MKIRKRVAKELNESEPFIDAIQDLTQNTSHVYTVIDLCSGFGIFSMILSELVSNEHVNEMWLLDKNFPCRSSAVMSHHISIQHLVGRPWPVPLRIRKVDLKKGREVRQLHKYVLQDKRVIIVGIHLCKARSVHAIHLFQSSANSVALMLKPCCLPRRRNVFAPANGKTVPIVYTFPNGYAFRPGSVSMQRYQCW
jgi:Methyltransferase domain